MLAQAGLVETGSHATALGVLGLGGASAYRLARSAETTGWLQRAGLWAALIYGVNQWFQPDQRQQVYREGARSLTCLALAAAPYEMTLTEFGNVKANVDKARAATEALASQLRLVGRYENRDDTWWLVRGGWNKLRWANDVLRNADLALGQIERTGPQLLHSVAEITQKTDEQASKVVGDISKLSEAVANLKPNANLLLGTEVFKLPKPEEQDADPPPGDVDTTPNTSGTGSTQQRAAAAGDCRPLTKQVDQSNQGAAVARVAPPTTGRDDTALGKRLLAVVKDLDDALGPVAGFVVRVAAARRAVQLPEACGKLLPKVTLWPDQRRITLHPDEVFQFQIEGDLGRPSAQFLTLTPPSKDLDLSMPLAQAATVVRLRAGSDIDKPLDTTVRISDSAGLTHFDIAVRVCGKG